MRTNVQDKADRGSSSLTNENIESSAVDEIVGLSHSLAVKRIGSHKERESKIIK
jgi:hypothetical protein